MRKPNLSRGAVAASALEAGGAQESVLVWPCPKPRRYPKDGLYAAGLCIARRAVLGQSNIRA